MINNLTDATAPPSRVITLETAREVIRLSELYLDGTLRLSLAADSRALSLSSMLATAATVLLGYSLASLGDITKLPLAVASGSAGVFFFAAVWYAVRTIRPRTFNILGTLRSQWSDAELHGNLADALISLASVYEDQALENVASLSENASEIETAYRLFVAGIPVSMIAGFLTYAAINGLPSIAN